MPTASNTPATKPWMHQPMNHPSSDCCLLWRKTNHALAPTAPVRSAAMTTGMAGPVPPAAP